MTQRLTPIITSHAAVPVSLASTRVAILVVSCDRYADLWEPFFRCFWKYWPDCPYPVFLGTGERDFAHSRLQTVKSGPDQSYSHNLAVMLRQLPYDHVIFWVEDRMLSAPVDSARVQGLVDHAVARGAGYLKLLPEHPMAYAADGAPCGEIPRRTSYRVSMTIALWRKATLLTLLDPAESAWELEKKGTHRSDARPEAFLGLPPAFKARPIFPHAHLVVKGRVTRDSLGFLQRERLEDFVAGRGLETVSSRLYRGLYNFGWSLLRPAQDALLRNAPGSRGDAPSVVI